MTKLFTYVGLSFSYSGHWFYIQDYLKAEDAYIVLTQGQYRKYTRRSVMELSDSGELQWHPRTASKPELLEAA